MESDGPVPTEVLHEMCFFGTTALRQVHQQELAAEDVSDTSLGCYDGEHADRSFGTRASQDARDGRVHFVPSGSLCPGRRTRRRTNRSPRADVARPGSFRRTSGPARQRGNKRSTQRHLRVAFCAFDAGFELMRLRMIGERPKRTVKQRKHRAEIPVRETQRSRMVQAMQPRCDDDP